MTKKLKPTKTFIIRHKQTKELWEASSGKTSWKAKNHAKSAWANTYWRKQHLKDDELIEAYKYKYLDEYRPEYATCKFNDRDVYEVVELKPESVISKEEVEFIKHTLKCLWDDANNDYYIAHGDEDNQKKVDEFFYENNGSIACLARCNELLDKLYESM